jgi:hypothetical protein
LSSEDDDDWDTTTSDDEGCRKGGEVREVSGEGSMKAAGRFNALPRASTDIAETKRRAICAASAVVRDILAGTSTMVREVGGQGSGYGARWLKVE